MAFWNADAAQDPGGQNLDAAQQQEFMKMLAAQAAGQGPSAAAMMLQQRAQQEQAQMMGQAAAARGVNPALALRNAQMAGVQVTQNANQDAAIQRTREQLAAQGLLGTTLAQSRGQDIQHDLGYSQLQQGASQFNAGQNAGVAGGVLNAAGSAIRYLGAGAGASALSGLFGSGKKIGTKSAGDNSGEGDLAGGNLGAGVENNGGATDFGGSNVGNFGNLAAKGGEVKNASVQAPHMAAGGIPAPDYGLPYWALPAAPIAPQVDSGNGLDIVRAPQHYNPTPMGQPIWTQPNLPVSPLFNPGGRSLASAGAGVSNNPIYTMPKIAPGSTPTGQVIPVPTGVPAAGTQVQHVMFAHGGPTSFVGKHLAMAKGGKVPAMVSPGERYLPPQAVKEVESGKKSPMKAGEKIPGKPKVPGAVDSYANDTVPKTLQKGGIVLPRHVTQSPDAAKKADAFVKAVLSHKSK